MKPHRWLRLIAALLLAASPALAETQTIDDFEAADLGDTRTDHRGKVHPSDLSLCTEPDDVRQGRQSLRFALDMTKKGSFSYCALWFRRPQPPRFPSPALSLWYRVRQSALIGRFRFYTGGTPAFTSAEVRLTGDTWQRLILRAWEPHRGAPPERWQQVNQFAFLATNGGDAVVYFDDLAFLSADEAERLAPAEDQPEQARPVGMVEYTPLPGVDRLAFRVPDASTMSPAERAELRVAVRVHRGDRTVIEQEMAGLENERGGSVDIRSLTPGEYRVTYRVHAAGRDRELREVALTVPERPPWQHQGIGLAGLDPDHVQPPWEPLRGDGDSVTLWGRRYRFGDLLLPAELESAGARLLAAPAFLTLDLGQGPQRVAASARTTARNAGRWEFAADGRLGGWRATSRATVEYDGLITYELALTPDGARSLNSATLALPLSADQARAYLAEPYLASGGIIPYGGENVDRIYFEQPSSGWIPDGQGVVWSRPHTPLLWLGNFDRGLGFFVDSDAGFRPQEPRDRPARLRLVREQGRVTLEVCLVSTPVTTARPLTYRFGLTATPVKPFPAGWRGWRMTARNWPIPEEIAGRKTGNMHVYWQEFTRKYGVLDPELRRPDAFAAAAAADHREGIAVMPYYAPQWITVGIFDPVKGEWLSKKPYFDTYEKEWRVVDGREVCYPTDPPAKTVTYAASISDNSWTDYLLYLMREQARRGADGYYSDCSGPTPDTNPLYGCGFLDEAGRRLPTFNLNPKRNLLKRALRMFSEERGGERRLSGLGIMHGSSVSQVLVPFFDLRLDGEFERSNLVELVRRDKSVAPYFYGRLYDIDTFRIQYDGRKLGIPTSFLPELRWVSDTTDLLPESVMLDPRATRDFLVYTLLTDTLVWPIWCHRDEVLKTWRVKDRFGIGADDVEFIPYWDARPAAVANVAEVKVTAYRRPKAALWVLGNVAFEARKVTLTVNPTRSGVADGTDLVDAYTGERFPVRDQQISLSLPPRDFRFLEAQTSGGSR